MRLFLNGIFVFILLNLVACAATQQTSYKRKEITMDLLRERFLDKKFAVRMQFYISREELIEETGYLKSAESDKAVLFEYYDARDKQYRNLEVPIQNINTIELASKGSDRFSKTQKVAMGSAIAMALLLVFAISI
ncbi:hypothetical protein L6Q79_10730 [bacterium]|nr:hypothetical protein [bacterium]NUN46003.1 hypothetical protein [bacterium]